MSASHEHLARHQEQLVRLIKIVVWHRNLLETHGRLEAFGNPAAETGTDSHAGRFVLPNYWLFFDVMMILEGCRPGIIHAHTHTHIHTQRVRVCLRHMCRLHQLLCVGWMSSMQSQMTQFWSRETRSLPAEAPAVCQRSVRNSKILFSFIKEWLFCRSSWVYEMSILKNG